MGQQLTSIPLPLWVACLTVLLAGCIDGNLSKADLFQEGEWRAQVYDDCLRPKPRDGLEVQDTPRLELELSPCVSVHAWTLVVADGPATLDLRMQGNDAVQSFHVIGDDFNEYREARGTYLNTTIEVPKSSFRIEAILNPVDVPTHLVVEVHVTSRA